MDVPVDKTPPTLFLTIPAGVRPDMVRPAKLGDDAAAMSWIVLTAPMLVVKLVGLKLAMPLAAVVASSMVITPKLPVELATLRAPVRVLTLVTPLPPAAKPQLLAGAPRQTVPLASGRVMVLLASGVAKPRVEVKLPVVDDRVVEPLPCKVRFWVAAPIVRAPPGVMARVPVLCSSGVVTLVVKVGLLAMVSWPRPDRLRLPLAPTARVPLELGIVIVLLDDRVAWEKVLLKPDAVPSRNLITPVLPPALPTVRPVPP